MKPLGQPGSLVQENAHRAFLSGTEAIVRMLLAQRTRDTEDGIRTGGFVSGYRGSPLGGLDEELWRHRRQLDDAAIRFLPAVNEDLAATAVLGTQRVGSDAEATVDGVFALWYGKGPGVDRSGDALRHGNAYGASPNGGVLVVAGDDHGCVSSSMSHQSDPSFVAWSMPIVNPASISEYIEFGLYGWALSRFSGNWVGFKAIAETVESASSMPLTLPPRLQRPEGYVYPPGGLHYRWPDLPSVGIEQRLHAKLDAVAAFALVNSIDKCVVPAPNARIGILTCGKAHLDLMEALCQLDLGVDALEKLGVRVMKVGLSYPIEKTRMLDFVRGLQQVFVVEEKAPIVEQQLKALLFNRPAHARPVVIGKTDENGHPLLPPWGELNPALLLPLLGRWLDRHMDGKRFAPRVEQRNAQTLPAAAPTAKRTPYYCPGCPHNLSTVVPEGSRAQAGIGCHFMASWMNRQTGGLTQMGGEGADWVAQSMFTTTPHVFQNLGDGTYFHSGYLALRQAVAAGTSITYKILFNDAVAMTGGQPIDGQLTAARIARQVLAEGVRKVVLVTDDPSRYAGPASDLPHEVSVHHRRELDAIQRELRGIPGVTVLIYDQLCAAEKRRRRKRTGHEAERHVVINAAACEGCGDCGKVANCLAIVPVDTPQGRKRTIDQSSCNKDFACLDAFCPGVVTVTGATLRRASADCLDAEVLRRLLDDYPEPEQADFGEQYNILVAGIGGTGVVTVGTILALAAHLEGKAATTLNFKGFAQKGGAVLNHIRFARDQAGLHPVRIGRAQADVLLACDLVTAASDDVINTIHHGRTVAVASRSEIPTGQINLDPDASLQTPKLIERIRFATGDAGFSQFDANHYGRAAFGDTVVANMLVAGYAWQRGAIPIGADAIEQAIVENKIAVDLNRTAFLFGRLLAADEAAARAMIEMKAPVISFSKKSSREQMIASNADFLRDYQDARYAGCYLDLVRKVEQLERRVMRSEAPLRLTDAVAKSLFRLMAFKDEYEVARLFTDGRFEQQLREQFEGSFRLHFHLAPPLLSTGERPQKMRFGPWMMPAMRVLSHLRFLRGSVLDPFGYTAVRRMEKRVLREYEQLLRSLPAVLARDNIDVVIELASLPESIRGYGHVKRAAVRNMQMRRDTLLEKLRKPDLPQKSAFALERYMQSLHDAA
ncbi:MAG TPA: indolepyruvate ferredoxin oxidoreductase family protein [Noviherbaspirillum sp.]